MKTLQELTLLDRFLFDETMDCPEAHEAALQIIFNNDNLKLLTPSQTEKELRTMPWLRQIRLDVYALDTERTVYDTEVQQKRTQDLIRRSRYYQGMLDVSLLDPGTVDFNLLNDSCVIMIMPFDLFGLGRYCYTFLSCCKEDKTLELGDGAQRIFLNTRGTNDHEVTKELADFLHYIENTDSAFAQQTGSARIQKIHGFVEQIKRSEEKGVKYMQAWEEKMYERLEGRKEGKAEGIKEGQKEGIIVGRAAGMLELLVDQLETLGPVPEEMKEKLSLEKDPARLKAWNKLAAGAASMEDFERKAGLS